MMEEIHFRHVPFSVWQKMSIHLEPEISSGNDWRMLAEKLGFTTDMINYFKSLKTPCTEELFKTYVTREDATVNRLQGALEAMKREDALQILQDHLNVIEQNHETDKRARHSHTPQENSWPNSSVIPDHFQEQSSHMPPTSMYRSQNEYKMPLSGGYISYNKARYPENGRSDSLIVQNPFPSNMNGFDSDVEMVETHRHNDVPAQLPATIMRGENQLPYSLFEHSLHSHGQPRADPRNGYFQQNFERMSPRGSHPEKPYIIKVSTPPMQRLQALAKMPAHLVPGQGYTNVIADQRMDDGHVPRNRPVKEEPVDRSHHVPSDLPRYVDVPKPSSSRKKNGFKNHNNTYPQMKPALDMNSNYPLNRGASMLAGMKPAEYRKAFHHIKIFVTYSNDGRKHLQRVLSLCENLVKNGFSCCVDINNRYISMLPSHEEKIAWYRTKFEESKFILVVPSQKYKKEIETPMTSKQAEEEQLHTQYIYKLMLEEYQARGQNTRFIPVLFDRGYRDLLPTWLAEGLTYAWPEKYMDLLWMLTCPEDRIKPKPKSFSRENSNPNSPCRDDDRMQPKPKSFLRENSNSPHGDDVVFS